MLLLITGATGKVGTNLIPRLKALPNPPRIRAMCHNRGFATSEALEVVTGDISDPNFARSAMAGVSHVIHLATCKETPEIVMDVTVKGLFWLLEEFRKSREAKQFILLGGDAGVGHFFYRHEGPITEKTPHMAYPGCYALSKVLEEVLLAQYRIQYGINGVCLRAPWIMEKDDFRYTLSFGDDVFGGPDWKTMVTPEVAARCRLEHAVPLLRDADGRPLKRNFVHVEDLVSAILAALDNPNAAAGLYNICMNEPVDYGEVATYLRSARGLPSINISSPYHSNWVDNTLAKFDLDWRPKYDLKRLIDEAWSYKREPNDPRKVWYPG